MGLTDHHIRQIEKALGFRLYDYQKKFKRD